MVMHAENVHGRAGVHNGVSSWERNRSQVGALTTGTVQDEFEWDTDDCYDYNTETWDCPVCRKEFQAEESLSKHLNSGTHDGDRYHCVDCSRKFSSLTALTQHQKSTGHSDRQQRLVHTAISDARHMGQLMLTNGSASTLPAEATLYFDGAAAPNPGRGGFGFHIIDDVRGIEIASDCGSIRKYPCTNNEAEYGALLKGLLAAQYQGIRRLRVRGDSELIIKQMRGEYAVTAHNMVALHGEAMKLARAFQVVTYEHIDRSLNSRADSLAREGVNM